MKKSGFTFVELMIAVVIGVFVTVTAAAAMREIISGQLTHQQITELSDEMRYTCSLIRNDLNNIYRNADFRKAKFELTYMDDMAENAVQSLTFYTISSHKARLAQPEGDVYEVEYFIKNDLDMNRSVLMRRYCPVVPGVFVADDVKSKGILAPTAKSIVGMQVRCYDGTEWTDEWNEEYGKFPQLIEVTFVAAQKEKKKSLMRSLFINIPRLKSTSNDSTSSDPQEDAEDYGSYMGDDFSDVSEEGDTQ